MLTQQQIQVVHPAKSHALSVCPKISQSLSVIEYEVVDVRGVAFLLLRGRGTCSPHRSSAM
jgi:hypothetical protein